MEFRTLLIGVIVLGLASGWMAQWVFPVVAMMAPDREVATSHGTKKCRTTRTVLDSKNAAPSCFGLVAEDLASGNRTYDEDGEEGLRRAIENPVIQQQLQREKRFRKAMRGDDSGDDRDEDSIEAEPLD